MIGSTSLNEVGEFPLYQDICGRGLPLKLQNIFIPWFWEISFGDPERLKFFNAPRRQERLTSLGNKVAK